MFSCRRLQSWLKANLKRNPFGIFSCLSLGQKLRGRGYSCGDDSKLSNCIEKFGIQFLVSVFTYGVFTLVYFGRLLEDRVLRKGEWVANLLGVQDNIKVKFTGRYNLAVKGQEYIIPNTGIN